MSGLIGALSGGGIFVVFALALLAWIARSPGNAERVGYWFYSGCRFISKRAELRALRNDVTYRVNNFAGAMQRRVTGYEPKGLEMRFVEEDLSPEAFMDSGRLVVRMRPRQGRDQNFLTVALLYMAHTAFPIVKHHLRPNQKKALDLSCTEKLIAEERADLVAEFVRLWINPQIRGNDVLERLLLQLKELDGAGLLMPVLCQELHLLSGRMLGSTNREVLRRELQEFIEFLQRVANRRTGDTTVPLTYRGPFLRMGLQIVARSGVREKKRGDLSNWLRYALETSASQSVDHIYFVGSGVGENRRLIEDVASEFCSRSGWILYARQDYGATILGADGAPRRVSNTMVLCRSRDAAPLVTSMAGAQAEGAAVDTGCEETPDGGV